MDIHFIKVKQFPLTSIIDIIEYETDNHFEFKLVFHKIEVILEASNKQSGKKWAEKIREGTCIATIYSYG